MKVSVPVRGNGRETFVLSHRRKSLMSFIVSVPVRGNGRETVVKNQEEKRYAFIVSVPVRGNGRETKLFYHAFKMFGTLFPSPCGEMVVKLFCTFQIPKTSQNTSFRPRAGKWS